MNPNREEALFQLALGKPAAKRAAWLDAECDGDNALRQRLEVLFAAHNQPETLLTTQADAARPTIKLDLADAPDEAVGQTLGRYKLLERVGEGGCGVVYVAEQTEPVRRRVALKVIKLGMDTKQVVARFEAERQGFEAGALAGYRTQISFSPEDKMGVIVLTDADDGDPGFYVKQVFALLAPAIKKATTATPVVAQPDPSWGNFVGTYRDPWGDTEIVVVNGELVMMDSREDDPKGSLLKLVPTEKNKFKIVAETFSYGEIGEFVSFELGADGKAVRMKVGENFTPRLK
jgi:hypothetical protein